MGDWRVKVLLAIAVLASVIGVMTVLSRNPAVAQPGDRVPVVTLVEAEQGSGFVSIPKFMEKGPIEYVCHSALPRESMDYAYSLSAVMTTAMNHWGTKSVTITVDIRKGQDGKRHTVITATHPGIGAP